MSYTLNNTDGAPTPLLVDVGQLIISHAIDCLSQSPNVWVKYSDC